MTIEKRADGSWVIEQRVGDRLFRVIYYFYTKSEARKLFRQYLKNTLA